MSRTLNRPLTPEERATLLEALMLVANPPRVPTLEECLAPVGLLGLSEEEAKHRYRLAVGAGYPPLTATDIAQILHAEKTGSSPKPPEVCSGCDLHWRGCTCFTAAEDPS